MTADLSVKEYALEQLSPNAQASLLSTHLLKNREEYTNHLAGKKILKEGKKPLFGIGSDIDEDSESVAEVELGKLLWHTTSYEGISESDPITLESSAVIIPRSMKAKAIQKKRTKEKAEVFTPSWVCCLQNDLVDNHVLYEDAFFKVDPVAKSWVVQDKPIDFTKAKEMDDWRLYLISPRLEITCGEGPYLFSRYDTVSGDTIPLRSESGTLQRIGILDRKFRVLEENTPDFDSDSKLQKWWLEHAFAALRSTYGYEWQGDNLLLARLNMLNTFVDYFKDKFGKVPGKKLIDQVAEIASQQLWQMDGLKFVSPMSCSADCKACSKKLRGGHNGVLPVIPWGSRFVIFEEFISED